MADFKEWADKLRFATYDYANSTEVIIRELLKDSLGSPVQTKTGQLYRGYLLRTSDVQVGMGKITLLGPVQPPCTCESEDVIKGPAGEFIFIVRRILVPSLPKERRIRGIAWYPALTQNASRHAGLSWRQDRSCLVQDICIVARAIAHSVEERGYFPTMQPTLTTHAPCSEDPMQRIP